MATWDGGQNGAIYYYALDLPGNSVQGLFDASGTITHRYRYTPFGEPLPATSSAVVNPLRFAARELDAATGLYYVRARLRLTVALAFSVGAQRLPAHRFRTVSACAVFQVISSVLVPRILFQAGFGIL